MKKICSVLMIFMLLSTLVMAQINILIFTEEHPSVRGLGTAILRVRNETQREHLEQVMNRIQLRDKERLNQLDDLTFEEQEDGSLQAEGSDDAKFLGLIKAKYTYKYEIKESSGKLTRLKKWYDFMFSGIKELEG